MKKMDGDATKTGYDSSPWNNKHQPPRFSADEFSVVNGAARHEL
jgi:hypothetical protein